MQLRGLTDQTAITHSLLLKIKVSIIQIFYIIIIYMLFLLLTRSAIPECFADYGCVSMQTCKLARLTTIPSLPVPLSTAPPPPIISNQHEPATSQSNRWATLWPSGTCSHIEEKDSYSHTLSLGLNAVNFTRIICSFSLKKTSGFLSFATKFSWYKSAVRTQWGLLTTRGQHFTVTHWRSTLSTSGHKNVWSTQYFKLNLESQHWHQVT